MRQRAGLSFWTLPICIGGCAAVAGITAIREFDRQIATYEKTQPQSAESDAESAAETTSDTETTEEAPSTESPVVNPLTDVGRRLDDFSVRLNAHLDEAAAAAKAPRTVSAAGASIDPRVALVAADVFDRRPRLAAEAAVRSFEVREKIAGLVSAATRELVGGSKSAADPVGRAGASPFQHREDLQRLFQELAASAQLPRHFVLGIKGERSGVCLAANDPASFGKSYAGSALFAAALAGRLVDGFDTIDGELFWGAAAPLVSPHGDIMAVVVYGSPVDAAALQAWSEQFGVEAAIYVAGPADEFHATYTASAAKDSEWKWGSLPAGLSERLTKAFHPDEPDAAFDVYQAATTAIETSSFKEGGSPSRSAAYLALPGRDGRLVGVLAFSAAAAPSAGTATISAAPTGALEAVERAKADLASLAELRQTLVDSAAAIAPQPSNQDATDSADEIASAGSSAEQLVAGARRARLTVLYSLGAASIVLVLSPFLARRRRSKQAPEPAVSAKKEATRRPPEGPKRPADAEPARAADDGKRSSVGSGSASVSPLAMLPGFSAFAGKSNAAESVEEEFDAPVTGALQAVLSSRLLDGQRILVAEDSSENRQLIGHVLRKAGAELMVAENSRAAIEAARNQTFDAIIVDAELPGMDGAAVIRTLRTNGYSGRIVGLTPAGATIVREDMIAAGGSDTLTKPIDYARLISTLISRGEAGRETVRYSPDIAAGVE